MTPQPVFLMGEADGLEAILREVIRPRVAYLAARPELLRTAEHFYRVEAGPPMVRMWVDRTTFRPYPATVQRLLPSEIGDLNRPVPARLCGVAAVQRDCGRRLLRRSRQRHARGRRRARTSSATGRGSLPSATS
jgi:hypothetical protein